MVMIGMYYFRFSDRKESYDSSQRTRTSDVGKLRQPIYIIRRKAPDQHYPHTEDQLLICSPATNEHHTCFSQLLI